MWITREKSGRLWIYDNLPFWNGDGWYGDPAGNDMELNSSLFPSLKWEDEPLEVELTPKSYN